MKEGRFMSPTRLTAAREYRGLTRKALAEQIGVQPMAVTGYEKGDWQPAGEVLERIAQILQFPVTWFVQDEISLVDTKVPTFRAQSRMSASIREQSSRTWDFGALIGEYLRKHYDLPSVAIPDLSQEPPEVAAQHLRDEWRLGNEPISNMVHLLEAKGVMVFWTNIKSQSVDACCHWSDEQPVILLNTNERAGDRLRFNAAHELAHLVLHREQSRQMLTVDRFAESDTQQQLPLDYEDAGSPNEARARREQEANRFASAFLLPRTAWVQQSPLQPELSAFLNLKPYWKVSMQAMIRRSYDLNLISEWQYEKAMTRVSINDWRKVEPGPITPEQSLLHKKVFQLMQKEGISSTDFARDLHIPFDVLITLMPVASEFAKLKMVVADHEVPMGGLRLVNG